MLFKAMIREEPYLSLNDYNCFIITGVAWLSAVRVVRCQVYSANERNPSFILYTVRHNFDMKLYLGKGQALMALMEMGYRCATDA